MRETSFIEQNKEKWSEFEHLLHEKSDDPDKLSDLYVQITDDLSYSRTFYPNRSVRVYLNGLAQQLFYKIYKNKKNRFANFIKFWKYELPQMMYLHRKEMGLSVFVFFLAMGIGVLSCFMDSDFTVHIMGERYMSMTEENIASGDPMAVYKQTNELDMAMGITLNNLRVAFITFIFGLLFAIGSIAVLIKNGIMVGTFQYYFYEQGLFQESFLTIWVHGALEIPAIIIAGGAGIVMGSGLVFPGTYARLHSFRVSARNGLMILLGLFPIIIMAGFIEGYLTRYTDAPDLFRATFIFCSFAFVIGYFCVYPWWLAKNGKIRKKVAPKLPADNVQELNYRRVKRNGEIFLDSFTFIKRNTSRVFGFVTIISLIYATASIVEYNLIGGDIIENFNPSYGFFVLYSSWPIEILKMLVIAVFGTWLSYFLVQSSEGVDLSAPLNKVHFRKFFLKNILKAIIVVAIFEGILALPVVWFCLLSFIVAPILCTWFFVAMKEKKPFFSTFGITMSIINSSWGKVLGMSGILILITFLANLAVKSPLTLAYTYFIQENLFSDAELVSQFSVFVERFLSFFASSTGFAFMLIGFSFLYFSLREIKSAESLRNRILRIGIRNQAFGIEKEDRYVES